MSRELDVAIAEALGYTVIMLGNHYFAVKNMQESVIKNLLPYYSSDGNAMMKLDAEMRERGRNLFLWNENDIWYAVYEEKGKEIEDEVEGVEGISGRIIPEAVAKAAYYALTGKGW